MCDLLITDPPYNVDYVGKTKDALKIKNDHIDDENFDYFLKDAFKNADSSLKKGAVFYIWHADKKAYYFFDACFNVDWQVRQCIIWVKNTIIMGRQDYQFKYEPCLYGWKKGLGHKWYADRKQKTVIEAIDLMTESELKETIRNLVNDLNCDTIYCDKPQRNDLHPTMKPIKLLAKLINNSSAKNDLVLDLFGGSGSTLIACEQLDRNCYMMEYDPQYCQVIIDRWENFTGRKAEKINV